MARVRSVNTKPEMLVRVALHAAGLRYRLHRADLPGKPDVVLSSRRAIVLVHGCFWHSHEGCGRARIPTARQEYWIPKLQRNAERDRANAKDLAALGWAVHTIWECETSNSEKLAALIRMLKANDKKFL